MIIVRMLLTMLMLMLTSVSKLMSVFDVSLNVDISLRSDTTPGDTSNVMLTSKTPRNTIPMPLTRSGANKFRQ